MSVACLNLCYTVKIQAQMKDERKDNIMPLVLGDVPVEEDELELDSEEEEGGVSGNEESDERRGEGEWEGQTPDALPRRYERFMRGELMQ